MPDHSGDQALGLDRRGINEEQDEQQTDYRRTS
jgi:hypothetical protein